MIYPIVGSFKSFEDYNRKASQVSESSFVAGGFQMSLNMLKRATGDVTPTECTAKDLQYSLLIMQKWIVFWILSSSFQLMEKLLFAKYLIPFYDFTRFMFTLWLISPLMILHKIDKEFFDYNSEMRKFLELGCGMFFYKILKPTLNGELEVLCNLNLPDLVRKLQNSWIGDLPIVKRILTLLLQYKDFNAKSKSSVFDTFADYTNYSSVKRYIFNDKSGESLSQKNDEPKGSNTTALNLSRMVDDYYIVDKPTPDGVTKRNVSNDEDRKSWIW